MFTAIDKDGNKIAIENAVKGCDYFCPDCGCPLILKAVDSPGIRTHFAHKKGADCDTFQHDMSDWHLDWQKRFPLDNREVSLEVNGIKHRADVLINNTVIEFQHSPIKAEEIARRNEFYLASGHNMVWVFDADEKIKKDYGGSIDPANLRGGTGLCWSRAKQQFNLKMDPRVRVFFHYKSELSVPQFSGRKIDILILITELGPKYFTFYDSIFYNQGPKYAYITIDNFLKEYGAPLENDTYSITDIINASESYKSQLKQLQARQQSRNIQNALNSYYRRPYKKGRRF